MMKRLRIHLTYLAVVLAALVAASPAAAQCDANGREGNLSDVLVGSTSLEWRLLVEHENVTLTVSAPCGLVVERTYRQGENPTFALKDVPAADPDGRYHWQLRIDPFVDSGLEKELAAAHASGSDGRLLEYSIRQKGLLPAGPFGQSGSFTVFRGEIVPPDEQEEGADDKSSVGLRPAAGAAANCPVEPSLETARLSTVLPAVDRGGSTRAVAAAQDQRRSTAFDQVIPDDLIVQGSECVGFDCVNNENFSFDTIRLKENNLRIHFDDTSTLAGFPANDWRLIANDSASGGASKFSIEDSTGARTPFTIRAGASTNSIFVDSTGRVGLRTSTPVLDLHINTSNTPGIRLEQNNSGGFTAQTWDIAGNEANFFVRDVTGGSRLPLRIRPGAPTSSVDISADGDVGVGTASPDAALHVLRSAANVVNMIELEATGAGGRPRLIFTNPDGVWFYETNGTNFDINRSGSGAPEEFRLASNGDLTIGGTLTELSSRSAKQGFAELDPAEVLAKLAALPVLEWTYTADEQEARHVGPMAEDFYRAFQLGDDDKHIAPSDKVGIALVAIQGLQQELAARDATIAELAAEKQGLEERLSRLERLFAELPAAPAP